MVQKSKNTLTIKNITNFIKKLSVLYSHIFGATQFSKYEQLGISHIGVKQS
jgi:hypothetical protein